MRRLESLVWSALAVACLAVPALAQNASLVGTARDAQQSVMPNVAITLTNTDTGVSQSTKTDAEGKLRISRGPPR